MRRDKVFRFLGVAFALGAFLGLVSGLAFGGPGPDTGTPVAAIPGTVRSNAVPASGSANTSSTLLGPMTPDKAAAIGANELGQIPVLLYHEIGEERGTDFRSPKDLAADIELLKSEGFLPINVRDLASGNIDIPAGTSPVVLTFDDSTLSQYNTLNDGTLDPESGLGVLRAATDRGGWAAKATFYCLIDVTSKDKELFGQYESRQEKLRNLVDWGYEVGSHTYSNLNLKKGSTLDIQKDLQTSQQVLQDLIGGGYRVTSLSVPSGEYPEDDNLLLRGLYDGKTYEYTSAVALGDSLCPSPFSTLFEPMRIPRIAVSGNSLRDAIAELRTKRELRYISDGDPTTVSAPAALAEELGAVRNDLGRPLIQY